MDALDRMLRRLVQNISQGFPEYLTRPFEAAELYQVIVPYRLNRRELELETNQDYELVVTQLLAGERNYLVGDPVMQEALRRELASPNPDTGAFRNFPDAQVALSPEILRRLDGRQGGRTGDGATAGGTAAGSAAAGAPAGEPPAERLGTTPPSIPAVAAAPAGAASGASDSTSDTVRVPRPPAPQPPSQPTSQPTPEDAVSLSQRAVKTIVGGGSCQYCGGALPEGRRISFCPHCGQNLTIIHCPACSTELEVGWRFCTTCGREQTAQSART